MSDLLPWAGEFMAGTLVIIQLFLVALVMTIIWGLLGAAGKLSGNRIFVSIASFYTVVFRGMPSFLTVLILYFGLATTLSSIAQSLDETTKFLDVPPFWAGALAISLAVGAYSAETFRGAFLGVDKGAVAAGFALGLTKRQVFVYIRLPLMWRLALPPFGNQMLSLMKDTALVSVIGVNELLFTAQMATTYSHKPFTMYFAVAVIFLFLATIIVGATAGLEKYANRHLRAR